MQLTQTNRSNNHGSALMVALIMGAIFCIMLGSYLQLTQSQVRMVSRSQTWNTSMVAAEAGLEEGLAMINRHANSGTLLTSWPLEAVHDGWDDLGGNVYCLERTIDERSRYKVYITNQNSSPVIKSIGYTSFSGADTTLERAILVNNSAGSFFLGGVLAKRGVNINGSVVIDSYDSRDPAYSTDGQWDINKRKDGGNVGSVLSNVVAAVVASGKAKIYGQIATGPKSTIAISGNADAGSLAWVDAGKKGIEPGWARNDLNVSIPNAPLPPAGPYLPLPAAGSVVLSGFGGTTYYSTSKAYQMTSKDYLVITNGTVVINAQEGIKLDALAAIKISPGSQLILYLGTQNTQLDGQGVVNSSGNPTNCIIYGQPNCKQIEINGGSAFVGYVYAPFADITLNGNSDFSGAMVGSSFQINGNMGFHYDESLGGPQSGSSIYRILAWREVSP